MTIKKDLTVKLDKVTGPFDQKILNEIVLWKVNRHAEIKNDTLKLLNELDPKSTELDLEMTRKILKLLIQHKGIQLPMASTILRFKVSIRPTPS